MKKTFISSLIMIFSVVFLSACMHQETSQEQDQAQAPAQEQSQQQVMNEWQKVGGALAEGKAARCEIRNRETNQTGEYYMKGENIRYTLRNSENSQQDGSFISDGEYVYSWTEENKQGMKFEMKQGEVSDQEMEEAVPSENNIPDLSDESSWRGFEEQGYTINCEVTEVDDSLFVPPTDIEFTDLSQMMMNEGENANQEFNPEQYRGMMQ